MPFIHCVFGNINKSCILHAEILGLYDALTCVGILILIQVLCLVNLCCEFGLKTHTNKIMMCGAKESSNQYQSNNKQQQ